MPHGVAVGVGARGVAEAEPLGVARSRLPLAVAHGAKEGDGAPVAEPLPLPATPPPKDTEGDPDGLEETGAVTVSEAP